MYLLYIMKSFTTPTGPLLTDIYTFAYMYSILSL